jgi:hypothetical protein
MVKNTERINNIYIVLTGGSDRYEISKKERKGANEVVKLGNIDGNVEDG